MTSAIAIAWLLSLPFYLLWGFALNRELFAPKGKLTRICLWAILLTIGALGLCAVIGVRPMVFETPLLVFGGLALLCFTWMRGIYLLLKQRKRHVVAER